MFQLSTRYWGDWGLSETQAAMDRRTKVAIFDDDETAIEREGIQST